MSDVYKSLYKNTDDHDYFDDHDHDDHDHDHDHDEYDHHHHMHFYSIDLMKYIQHLYASVELDKWKLTKMWKQTKLKIEIDQLVTDIDSLQTLQYMVRYRYPHRDNDEIN